ncbi:hypothetical protein U1Q18_000264 [Sarracenia purpurea var. burkii]
MGLFSFLLGKDIIRFIKRKDSDAGEAGRALEELRGALYSELRSAEGAKRQQQRICGPIVAMTFNFVVAVGIILANKLAFSLLPVSPPSKTTPFSSLFSLGAVMAFASGLANTSLQHNSVGFYQMAKIAVTPTIVLAEFILFRKTISLNKILALAVVSVGVAVATVTDLEFNIFGASIAIAWIIPSAINKILWSNLQQQANWTALALMWKTTPVTIFFLLALMPWLDPPGVSSFQWNLSNLSAVLTSAALGFLLQWSGALALGATSATSHVVLGQFKTCVILVGGYTLFDSDPGFVSICGAVAALGGMSVYTSLNLKQSKEANPPNLTISSLKPKNPDDKTQQSDTSNVV